MKFKTKRVNESLEGDLYSAGIDYDYLDEDNGLTAIVVHNGQDYFSKVNEIAEKNRRYDGVQLMRNALTYYNTYITDEDKKKYDWSSSSRDLFIDLDKYDEVDESVKVNESFAYIYDKKRGLYYNPYYEDMWRNNYDQANIVDISVAESDLKKLRSGDYNNLLLSDQDPYNDLTYVIVDESVNCRIYKGVRIKESII